MAPGCPRALPALRENRMVMHSNHAKHSAIHLA